MIRLTPMRKTRAPSPIRDSLRTDIGFFEADKIKCVSGYSKVGIVPNEEIKKFQGPKEERDSRTKKHSLYTGRGLKHMRYSTRNGPRKDEGPALTPP